MIITNQPVRMPNPSFVPIIGSGFGDIAQQQQFWAGMNNRVDEANLGRAAEAQHTRNNWLAQVARMQQDEQDRQTQLGLSSMALDRESKRQNYEDTESRRRFDINTDLTKGQQALEKKHWDFNQNERNKAERKSLDLAENFGKAKSSEADELGSKLDEATQAYNNSKADLDKSIARIQGKYPGVRWDNRQKLFVGSGFGPPLDPQKLQAANEEFANDKSDADRAAIDYSTAREAYNNLEKEASSYGLTVQKRGKKRVLFSPAHNTFFGDAGSKASVNPFESEFGAMSDGASAMRNPPPLAGFSPANIGEGSGSMSVRNAPLRIGRFSVMPQ